MILLYTRGETEAEVKQLAQGHGGKTVAEARTGVKASSVPIFCLNHQKKKNPFPPSPPALLILLLRFNPPFSGQRVKIQRY